MLRILSGHVVSPEAGTSACSLWQVRRKNLAVVAARRGTAYVLGCSARRCGRCHGPRPTAHRPAVSTSMLPFVLPPSPLYVLACLLHACVHTMVK